jgi:hypothetical protein
MRNTQMAIQLFLRRYYDVIKLVLLVFIAAMAVYFLVNATTTQTRNTRERIQNTEKIVQSIQEESRLQTEIINDQFRALCIVIFQTSGQEGLEKLDPPLETICKNLSVDNEQNQDGTRPTAENESSAFFPPATPQSSEPQAQSEQPAARPTPTQPTPRPQPVDEPEPNPEPETPPRAVVDPVTRTIRGVFDAIGL